MADFASVYGLANRPTTELANPMDIYGKMQGIKANQMALEDQQAKRKMAEDARNLFKEAGGDFRKAATMASERGMIEHAEKFGSVADAHDTEVAKAKEAASKMTAQQRADALSRIQEVGKFSKWVLSQPPEKQQQAFDMGASQLGQFIPEIGAMAGKPVDADRLMLMSSQMDAFGQALEGEKPLTDLGKLAFDLKKGLISQDQYNAAVRKATTHAPGTSVSVNMGQEKEEGKTVGKGFGETYIKIQDAGMSAGNKLNRYTRMEDLLKGVQTGRLTPTSTQVAAIADSLGIKIDPTLDAKQAVEALSNEISLELRNPSGGAGMPGAMSDKDREFLVSMTPGLAKTAKGNQLIIETAKKLAQRDRDVAQIARKYRQKNGSLDEGFYDELAAFSDANPLFSAKPKAPSATGSKTADDLLKILGK